MASNFNDNDEIISWINITPLVDIFLVLLIIFMVTAKFFLNEPEKTKKIVVDLPVAATGERSKEKPLLSIVLAKDGTIFLNGNERDVAGISAEIAGLLKKYSDIEAVISADREVAHGKVVRVIDLIKSAGVRRFAINVKEQDIE